MPEPRSISHEESSVTNLTREEHRRAGQAARLTEMANYVITLLLCAKGGGSSVFKHGLSAIASATAE